MNLASYPGSLPLRGREGEPGTHCMCMCERGWHATSTLFKDPSHNFTNLQLPRPTSALLTSQVQFMWVVAAFAMMAA